MRHPPALDAPVPGAENRPMEDSRQLDERIARESRLAAVAATGLLDAPPVAGLDRLTARAATLLSVPSTFVSLVDRHRDFYASHFGFGEPLGSVRQLEGRTFCHYAIASTSPLVIGDTERHPVYRDVPTVTTLGVRAYLGVPLVLGGEVIGSHCAIAFEPRTWRDEDVAGMRELAAAAIAVIEHRIAGTPLVLPDQDAM